MTRIFLNLRNLSICATGSVSNSSIISLMLHELMHYAYQNSNKAYMDIFNEYIHNFYKTFFNDYFEQEIPNKLIDKYVKSLYIFEKAMKGKEMFENLNNILEYAQTKGDKNLAHMNSKAFEKLFLYLSGEVKNEVGIKLSELSRNFFTKSMITSYRETFNKMNPEIAKRYEGINDSVNFASVFYQEFIATSEVAAMISGLLVKEIYKQQINLNEDNPITMMITNI